MVFIGHKQSWQTEVMRSEPSETHGIDILATETPLLLKGV